MTVTRVPASLRAAARVSARAACLRGSACVLLLCLTGAAVRADPIASVWPRRDGLPPLPLPGPGEGAVPSPAPGLGGDFPRSQPRPPDFMPLPAPVQAPVVRADVRPAPRAARPRVPGEIWIGIGWGAALMVGGAVMNGLLWRDGAVPPGSAGHIGGSTTVYAGVSAALWSGAAISLGTSLGVMLRQATNRPAPPPEPAPAAPQREDDGPGPGEPVASRSL